MSLYSGVTPRCKCISSTSKERFTKKYSYNVFCIIIGVVTELRFDCTPSISRDITQESLGNFREVLFQDSNVPFPCDLLLSFGKGHQSEKQKRGSATKLLHPCFPSLGSCRKGLEYIPFRSLAFPLFFPTKSEQWRQLPSIANYRQYYPSGICTLLLSMETISVARRKSTAAKIKSSTGKHDKSTTAGRKSTTAKESQPQENMTSAILMISCCCEWQDLILYQDWLGREKEKIRFECGSCP